MNYVFPVPDIRSLTIAGSDQRFAVGRIFCIGRNYAAHAREMGMDEREPPFFFMKAPNAIVDATNPIGIAYPSMTSNVHHEIELVAAIGKKGYRVNQYEALSLVYGYAVGLDMTRRDVQIALREKGRPWELGKAFEQSAPVGPIVLSEKLPEIHSADIRVDVNGKTKQRARLDQMIWSVAESIAFLSQYEPLYPGDLIMTGTPEGVGAVVPGDVMEGHISGLPSIQVKVTQSRTNE